MAFHYPLDLRFKIIALAPQFYVTDADENQVLFVRQKILNLREDVRIFSDDTKTRELFRINADRILDFSAHYHFTDSLTERPLGAIKHKGMRSIWRAHYLLLDAQGEQTHHMTEDDPWIKVADALLEFIPFADLISGYIFHPSYTIYHTATEKPVMRMTKQPSFFERRFRIERLNDSVSEDDEKRLLLSLLMSIQLERSRG
jgi:hypothetical protein